MAAPRATLTTAQPASHTTNRHLSHTRNHTRFPPRVTPSEGLDY
jgi:hypothetical protein